VTLQRPLFMQATGGDTPFSYAAVATRQMYDVMYAGEGVINLGLQVTQRGAGANMTVDVAAGSCVIAGDDAAGQGKYLCVNDAGALSVVVPAAPVSGTRIHRVIARIKDKLHSGSWTTYEWTIELLADTGSGTPALPASAIPLARVTVTAGQVAVVNANITDDRISAPLTGGQYRQVSADAGRSPNPFVSEKIWRTDKTCFETWSGTAWRESYIAGEGPAWTQYTPAWTSSGTAPALGNGTSIGRYLRVGKMVTFNLELILGSTSTIGTGSYSLSLPVAAAISPTTQYVNARVFCASVNYMAQASLAASTSALLTVNTGGTGGLTNVTNTNPGTFASGAIIRIFGTYEAA
jgi:hypothetical protein